MAMTKCKECGKEVSTSAKKCPHCGVSNPNPSKTNIIILIVVVLIIWWVWSNQNDKVKETSSNYSTSNASYEKLDSEVGCGSKYSKDKKSDIFNLRYKNRWMTWRGEIVLVEADSVSLNIDGKGTQDLAVDFANKTAGYNLTKGTFVTVRFLMKSTGGCFLPFSGVKATIVR